MLNNGEGGDFLLRFSGPLDTSILQSACQRLVKIHTALRSVFVRVDETLLQVVLREFDAPFTVHENIKGKDPIDFARELCSLRGESRFPLGHPPLQFTLISGEGEHALIMRLSHTQYDRICQYTIMSDLRTVYQEPEGSSTVSTSDYSLYARQITHQQTQETFAFWRNFLSDSTITKLPYAVPQNGTKEAVLECITNIPIANPPVGITMASMVQRPPRSNRHRRPRLRATSQHARHLPPRRHLLQLLPHPPEIPTILDYFRSPARRPKSARAEHAFRNRAVVPYHIREHQVACWHSTTDTGRPSGLLHRV